MCLIAFEWQPESPLQLAVIGNRDEFYNRPTESARPWDDHPELIAGRDLLAGGSWMGATACGRFAAVTNFRNPKAPIGQRSRGELVSDFLIRDITAETYSQRVARRAHNYGPFSLLLADGEQLFLVDDRSQAQRLPAGSYSLSNARLDSGWPKQQRANLAWQQALTDCRKQPPTLAQLQQLTHALDSREQAEEAVLPATGVARDLERQLSSCFIHFDGYGTRATSIYLRYAEHALYAEQSFNKLGQAQGFVAFIAKRAHDGSLGNWQELGRIETT